MTHANSFSLLLALFLVTLQCLGQSSIAVQSDSTRLAQLTNAQKSSSLIPMSIDMLRSFIEVAPRSYSIMLLLSAPPNICKACGNVEKLFTSISKDYKHLPKSSQASKPLFFVLVRITGSEKEFMTLYDLRHIPVIYFMGASNRKTFPKPLSDSSPDSYPFQNFGGRIDTIKQFINDKSGSRLRVVRGGYQIPFVETVRAFKPLIFTMAGSVAFMVFATGAYNKPMLWFALAMLVYIFSVGGGHYSWINKTPFAVVNEQGETEYLAAGSRSQYAAEGFLVSATCVTISVMVIFIRELPSFIPNKNFQLFVGTGLLSMTSIAISLLLVVFHFVSCQSLSAASVIYHF